MPGAVFLDRDGVLNEAVVRDGKPVAPTSLADFRIYPEAAPALARLKAGGYLLIVVTNQPDVARGSQTREAVEQINQRLAEQLPLSAIFTCFHDNQDGCDCRKPRPGMLVEAAEIHQIDLSNSFMVGDRWSDVVAGQAAGCRTFLIDLPYSQRRRCTPDFTVANLLEAAHQIVQLGEIL